MELSCRRSASWRTRSSSRGVGGRLALRRSNSPEDIAGLALFMASDAARNVTGQSWNVDDGLVNGLIFEPERRLRTTA